MIRRLGLCVGVLALPFAGLTAETSPWKETTWRGEPALSSTSEGWKAIVSLERGRLMHFGPAESDLNLLFAPATRSDLAGWGGHRVWLGPQSTWPDIWPPPTAWEHSKAESHTVSGGVLRLVMPDAGGGWPRLARIYSWDGAKLACTVELSGGTRAAQLIQIFQVPPKNRVEATPQPDAHAPLGYVLLPAGNVSRLTANFPPPPHVTRRETNLLLHHIAVIQKLGFPPQTLTADDGGHSLRVGRGPQQGQPVAEPDQGFSTQVYLGGAEPFIELEQLTPLFSPATPASSVVILEGAAH